MRLRISIRGFVRPSVGPSVRRSVRRSVRNAFCQKMRGSSYAEYSALFYNCRNCIKFFWVPPLNLCASMRAWQNSAISMTAGEVEIWRRVWTDSEEVSTGMGKNEQNYHGLHDQLALMSIDPHGGVLSLSKNMWRTSQRWEYSFMGNTIIWHRLKQSHWGQKKPDVWPLLYIATRMSHSISQGHNRSFHAFNAI